MRQTAKVCTNPLKYHPLYIIQARDTKKVWGNYRLKFVIVCVILHTPLSLPTELTSPSTGPKMPRITILGHF